MADEHGLILVYKEEFHHVFTEHRDHPEFGPLLVRMKVVDSKGESAMDFDQWDAASACQNRPLLLQLIMLRPFRYLCRLCVSEALGMI
jgi:hypothetical protein